jgi:hypothetical protein
MKADYFAGAGAGAGAGASPGFAGSAGADVAFSVVVVVVDLVSSFTAGAFCSPDGPQATKAKLAKNEMAINSTKNFFILFTSFLLKFLFRRS